MAIKTIEILNVMVFKRHLRKNNAAFKSIEEGDSFNDGFKIEFCDGINVLIGENGVGKTTILKMIYAATQWSIKQTDQGKTKRLIQPNLPKLLYIDFKLIPQIPYKIGV